MWLDFLSKLHVLLKNAFIDEQATVYLERLIIPSGST